MSFGCWYPATNMSQQDNQRDLSDVSRLTRHVRTRDQGDLLFARLEIGIVGHERASARSVL